MKQRITADFADVNDASESIIVKSSGETLGVSVSGTWAGAVDVQRKTNGAWVNTGNQYTADAAASLTVARGEYRMIFTTDTSGAPHVELWQ